MQATTVMIFRQTEETIRINKVTVPWFKSNFNGWFLRAQDVASLAQVPLKEARAIYERVFQGAARTLWCDWHSASIFLRAIRDHHESQELRKATYDVWKALKEEWGYNDEFDKFDSEIIPVSAGGVFLPAMNVTELDEKWGIKLLGGFTHTVKIGDGKGSQNAIPLQYLTVNDSQVQALISSVIASDDEIVPKSYRAYVAAAKKTKLVISEVDAPLPTGKSNKAIRREFTDQAAEIEHLTKIIEAAGIDPVTGVKTDPEKSRQFTVARHMLLHIINEHYPMLYVQVRLLMEVSREFGEVNKGWDHKKFETVFNPTKILSLLRTIHERCRDIDNFDQGTIADIESAVRANIGRPGRLPQEMLRLVRGSSRYSQDLDKIPRAA